MNRDERGRGGVIVVVVAALVLMLPVLYILSMGPACWLADREIIYPDNPYLTGFYWPIIRGSELCPSFGQFVGWYQSFWVR